MKKEMMHKMRTTLETHSRGRDVTVKMTEHVVASAACQALPPTCGDRAPVICQALF